MFSKSVFQERGGGGAWNGERSWRGSAASQKLGAAPRGDKQVSHSLSSWQRHLSLHENLSRALPRLPGCECAPVLAPRTRRWLALCSSCLGSARCLSLGPSVRRGPGREPWPLSHSRHLCHSPGAEQGLAWVSAGSRRIPDASKYEQIVHQVKGCNQGSGGDWGALRRDDPPPVVSWFGVEQPISSNFSGWSGH